MVVGTLRFLPPPNRRLEVLEILRCIQGPVQAEPGCAGFDIYEEQGPDAAVVLVERWHTQTALEVAYPLRQLPQHPGRAGALRQPAGGPFRPRVRQ